MTVISRVNTNQKSIKSRPFAYYLNIIIIILIVAGTAEYIALTNRIVSGSFSVKQLKDKYEKINLSIDLNSAKNEAKYSLETLAEFARSKGMVETTDTTSVFSDSGVAINNPSVH